MQQQLPYIYIGKFVQAISKPEWLGNDPRVKKNLQDLTRLAQDIKTAEQVLEFNSNTINAAEVKAQRVGKVSMAESLKLKRAQGKIGESSTKCRDYYTRFAQALDQLIDAVGYERLQRMFKHMGVDEDTLESHLKTVRQRYQDNGFIFENMLDAALADAATGKVGEEVAIQASAFFQDYDRFKATTTIPSDALFLVTPGQLSQFDCEPERREAIKDRLLITQLVLIRKMTAQWAEEHRGVVEELEAARSSPGM
jgi:hypothetical protein